MKPFAFVALAAVSIVAAFACSDGPAAAGPPPLRVVPTEATLEHDEAVNFRVSRGDAEIWFADVTVTSANPGVANTCGGWLAVCPIGSGTTTLTFTFEGASVTARVTTFPNRFVFQTDTPFVVGHRQLVKGRYTDHDRPLIAFRTLDSSAIGIGNLTTNALTMELKKLGSFALEAISISDTTLRDTLRVSVVAPKIASITTSAPAVIAGGVPVTFAVAVRDQARGVLHGIIPQVTIAEGASTARVLAVTPVNDTSATVLVTLQPMSGGTATLRLATAGALAVNVPIVQRSVARDSSVITSSGRLVEIFANDIANVANARIIAQPQHGSAMLESRGVRYTPAPGYNGLDSLVYVASSGTRTDTASVRFALMPGPFTAAPVGPAASLTPVDLNRGGQLAGTLGLPGGMTRAFRWTAGRFDTLQYNGLATEAVAIDDTGNVLGYSREGLGRRPLLWRAGSSVAVDLRTGLISSFENIRMSPSGVIAIQFGTSVLRIRGDKRDTLGAVALLYGVNDAGEIVVADHVSWSQLSIRAANGFPRRIPIADYGSGSSAQWIGNGGGVIGSTSNYFETRLGSFLYDGATLRYLWKVFGPWFGIASRINEDGWILGTVSVSGAVIPALFIRDAGVTLSALIDPSLRLVSAGQLSNSGKFVGTVVDAAGEKQIVVFAPAVR
jgi:hypothetical protein